MTSLPLPAPVFRILAAVIEERAGLVFQPDDAPALAERVTPRALELGFDSLLEYYYHLKYDPRGAEELDALVETLLIHETYFFREIAQLRALVEHVLAPAAADRRQRVWCAAASTGEEIYTLAMLLDERGLLGRVSLLATDLSGAALAKARAGEYGERSLRATPPEALGRWLRRTGSKVSVDAALRASVEWARVNLIDAAAVRALGVFDAILCRNVLIYFSDDVARRVVDTLIGCLRPGGYLLVGASESLLRFGTSLQSVELGGAFFYRKVGA